MVRLIHNVFIHGKRPSIVDSGKTLRMNTLAERLKFARQQAGFRTATEAAESLGVGAPTYTHHENGTRAPRNDDLAHYARRFRVTTDWLLTGKTGGITDSSCMSAVRTIKRYLSGKSFDQLSAEDLGEILLVVAHSIDRDPAAVSASGTMIQEMLDERLRRAT